MEGRCGLEYGFGFPSLRGSGRQSILQLKARLIGSQPEGYIGTQLENGREANKVNV